MLVVFVQVPQLAYVSFMNIYLMTSVNGLYDTQKPMSVFWGLGKKNTKWQFEKGILLPDFDVFGKMLLQWKLGNLL